MIEYAIIEDGYIRAKALEPIYYNDKDPETGKFVEKVITVEDQIKNLPPGWKPLDKVDEERMIPSSDDRVVKLVPYDAGDRISYHYEEMLDIQMIHSQISALKDELAGSDYKVIKSYETSLLGGDMPYNLQELHKSRQAIRDRINELEEKLTISNE
nr:MAG TPA: hypothetical protein [Caudoviricetes sp.]